MFIIGTGGLVAAFVFIAALLLSLNLYSLWSWWVKGLAIVLTSLLYIVTYLSVPALIGWPSDDPLPERFRLLGVHVQEPSQLTGSTGRIFLWATDMDAPTDSPPRNYNVRYSAELHQRVTEAGTKLRKGIPQLGESGVGEVAVDDPHAAQAERRVEFFDMPDPLFPEK
jgi:hypothetical protein